MRWIRHRASNLTQYIGILRRRSEIVRAIRAFFDSRDFVEVETAVRIAAPAPEEHIDCPVVSGPDGARTYLRASPELQMKKLLSAGLERIYQLGPCFREGERGSRHNPEFTMLEWYRKGATYHAIMRDTLELISALTGGEEEVRWREIPVREAYCRHAKWDPWTEWDQDRFDFDMATKIEPALKDMGGIVFLKDYPHQAASLSKIGTGRDGERFAERWELYWDGMEIANCFSELCDPGEQRLRFERSKEARRRLGESDYPIDQDFFGCLENIESASGVALGVDRLVMMLTGAKDILAVRAKI